VKRAASAAEYLDGHLDDAATLRDNLRDLARANRLTGGARLSVRAISFLVPDLDPLSVLDVGTGAADIPVALITDARERGRRLTVTAVDSRREVIDAARAARPELVRVPGLTLDVADGRALPYSDASFDVAHASLVLHHLEPDEAIAFLGELARVARRGVVVNDLSRRRHTLLGAWLLSRACTRNRYSRHDAPLSARRAYTQTEAIALVARAGLRPVYDVDILFGHRWAIAAVTR
jgi:ubiquinone/menaquinone biosynthesis C-methylase UbiE